MTNKNQQQLFPEFEQFVQKNDLKSEKGKTSIQIPRILGRGSTRAVGLDLPPAPIERHEELLKFSFPIKAPKSSGLENEIKQASKAINESEAILHQPEQRRRFALKILHELKEQHGIDSGDKDNHFFAGRFILSPDKNGKNWSWSITPHYQIISRIPPDENYIKQAYSKSLELVRQWTIAPEQFSQKLSLAWNIARHFNPSEKVLIADVAKCYKVAAQDEKFWAQPMKSKFQDTQEVAFLINIINWHRDRKLVEQSRFKLEPATLNQALGPRAKPFYFPTNPEGTTARPMVHITRMSVTKE